MPVACCDPPYAIMLFLIAEAPFHYCRAKIAEYATGGMDVLIFILRLGTFAGEACGDAMLGAVFAGVIVGVDGVTAELLCINPGQFFVILNAFLYPRPFIECLKGVMLDEGYAVYLYVVDFGSELGGFVFLAALYGADVRSIDADNTVLDFLVVEMVGLLTQDFADCNQPAFLICRQMNDGLELGALAVPLRE